MQNNIKIVLMKCATLAIILSITIGCFYIGCVYTVNNIQVRYISQAELLNLEKIRIASKSTSDKQLFFGKPEKAIKLIEQYQKQMSKQGALVLLTDSKIYGNNLHSVSKIVHSEIIKNLQEGAERK